MTFLQFICESLMGPPFKSGRVDGESYWSCPWCGSRAFRTKPKHPKYADKFLCYRPTYRLLAEWQTRGLDLSLGTLSDGLQRLLPLFEPVYQQLIAHNQKQQHWHADETRWLVFATVEGKVGYRWFLWVFHSAQAVVFVLSSGRAHDVPQEHLGLVGAPGTPGRGFSALIATQPTRR